MVKSCILLSFIFLRCLNTAYAQSFPDASESAPLGYQGKVFQLSQSYPVSMLTIVEMSWMNIDYSMQLAVGIFLFLSGPGTISIDKRYFTDSIKKPN